MSEWQLIDTAPKTGEKIWLAAFDEKGQQEESMPYMMWGHIKKNGLFPGKVGMWMTENGGLTWNDHPDLGGGPTHWKPMQEPPR